MRHSRTIASRACSAFLPSLLALLLAAPARPYDVPLSESSIRDAYFLGTRIGGVSPDFIAQYARSIPALRQGNCTSALRIETPFLQIARHAREVPNYTAQDAVKEFYGKPMVFRMHLDICYQVRAPLDAVKIKIIQNKRTLIPLSFQSTPYAEATEFGFLPANGEQLDLEFASSRIDSSTLTILIDTPNDQHTTTEFDLASIR